MMQINARGGMVAYIVHNIVEKVLAVGLRQGPQAGLKEFSIQLPYSDTEFTAAIERGVRDELDIRVPGEFDFGEDTQGNNWRKRVLPDPIPRGRGTNRPRLEATSTIQVAQGSRDPPPRSTTRAQRSGPSRQRRPALPQQEEPPDNSWQPGTDQWRATSWQQGSDEWQDSSWQQGTNEWQDNSWWPGAAEQPDSFRQPGEPLWWPDVMSVTLEESQPEIHSI